MKNFPLQNKKLKLAMLGMTEGNGHAYSWSIIINGSFNSKALAKCPYPGIIEYISKQPQNTLGIKDAKVTHVWTEDSKASKLVSDMADVPNIVKKSTDVIGEVDAVLISTDIGSEHVDRCKPFVEAGIPIFVDKPLCDNLQDLKIFDEWIKVGKPIISSSAMRYTKEFEPYHKSTYELGDLKYVSVAMAKSWETYGIHALELIYPILGPGFESIQNTGHKNRNFLHLKHSSNVDINIADIYDMNGGFGLVSLIGKNSNIQLQPKDTFYAFKKQLISYIDYLRTGVKPMPWSETYELMQLVAAGKESRDKGGIKINIGGIQNK